LSVAIAKRLKTVVFSADSRQFFKEMSIGTAKPSPEELGGIKHYFIDSHSIHDELSLATYIKEAEYLLRDEFKNQDTILLTGGSGMFIDGLIFGIDDIPHSKKLRDELSAEVEAQGTNHLLLEIEEKDPDYYVEFDRSNPVRVIRAIEVMRLTGKTYSELRTRSKKSQDYEIDYFVINHSREKLYERINQRVDLMMKAGLLEEVKSLLPYRHLQALNTVGYSELFNYLDGKTNFQEAIDLIKQNSRRYAKRQMTWFRRNEDAIWETAGEILDRYERGG